MIKQKEAYFRGLTQSERITALKENAREQYNKNIVRYYSEEELTAMKHDLSDVDISMNDAEIEKKELTKEVNDRIKVFKLKRSALLRDIKNKYYESEETVFDIDNQDDGTMETYDCQGNLIATRRLTPKEKQTTIKLQTTKTA